MHKTEQMQHIDSVLAQIADDRVLPATSAKDDLITQSWARCVHQYRLDPTRPREARVLTASEVRERQEVVEKFLQVARFGIEQLYRHVAGMGYVLLLTDSQGVTVDHIGSHSQAKDLRKAGLCLGSDWNEAYAGTCGVGTAIAEGRAFTCHQTDHFDATHIQLTCTTSPLFDPYGKLLGVLDISALHSPEPKSSQYMALELVKIYAQRIENANFLDCFRHQWILRLSQAPEFVDVDPQYLLAVDHAGAIIGFNRSMQLLLETISPSLKQPGKLRDASHWIGRNIEDFFQCQVDDLPRLMNVDNKSQRALLTQHTRQLLFASVIAPKPRSQPVSRRPRGAGQNSLSSTCFAGLSGGDAQMQRHIERAGRLIDARINILLTGETGTGKEYFAKALHKASLRAKKPFVAVNCAALPESLIESELFGYEAGAFTGALNKGKTGLILTADGGTLFLDEIGDMPMALQARLLRVLAQREVLPIGASQPQPVDLYIISATHRDLGAMIAQGEFREDLYYRLNGFMLTLPSLRQRQDKHFLIDKILREESPDRLLSVSPELKQRLSAYHWPGNIRELRNVLRFAAAVCNGDVLEVADLPDHLQAPVPKPVAETAPASASTGTIAAADDQPVAGQHLQTLLQGRQWNVSAVARELGVSRVTIYRQMAKYGIVSPNKR